MPDWSVFGAVSLVLTLGFVVLARSSARAVRAALDARDDPVAPPQPSLGVLESDRLLVGNVVASHGLLLALVVGTIWVTRVPLALIGLRPPNPELVVLGLGFGVGLAAANEASARLAERVGLDRDERLRELLAPDGPAGWVTLLVVVLPLVALAEELLFRGVLIGGLTSGFGFPVWALAVGSSLTFGLGHGLQGQAGIAVTAGLGFALAAGFVLTDSLTVVVVAHYVVNALEFVVNEGPLGRAA